LASSRVNLSGGPGNRSLQLRATYQRSWTISSANAEPSPADAIRCYGFHPEKMMENAVTLASSRANSAGGSGSSSLQLRAIPQQSP
ncbi:MAG: hypothetical protein AAFR61_30675, partial [Bacteroidota bacterium]